MEHLLLKAATTATDQGTFTAVISTASVDRDKDIIEPAAMVASLTKWATLGKLVPLAYNHTDEVIGHIDPSSVTVQNDEVIAKGWVDRSTQRGQDVWRLVKSGTLSFSFGFLYDPETSAQLEGGRYRVKELDIFEISAIPVGPANNDTRVLNWKSLEERDQVFTELQEVKGRLDKLEQALEDQKSEAEETDKATQEKSRSVDPLRQQAEAVALEVASGGPLPATKQAPPEPEPELVDLAELKDRMREATLAALSGIETEH